MGRFVTAVTTLLAPALVPATATDAAAGPADVVVRVHRSVGPVSLGMTRAAALEALGSPTTARRRSLRYDDTDLRVGLDASGRRVVGIVVERRGVCTARDVCIGRRGGLRLLRRLYGPALRLHRDAGWYFYVLPGRVGDRAVETTFDVPAGARDRPQDVVLRISVADAGRAGGVSVRRSVSAVEARTGGPAGLP